MVIEKFNRSESAQKIHASRDDVKFMHIDFGGCGFFGLEVWLPFKNGQISLSGHGL